MGKFERSRLLFKTSISVITQNKQLLLFPIVITLLTGLIILFFIVPAALWPTGYSYVSPEHWQAIGHRFFTMSATGSGIHPSYSPTAALF